MFWKVYFWLSFCALVAAYIFIGAEDAPAMVDMLFITLAVSALFLYAYSKKLLPVFFWRCFFVMLVLWTFSYEVVLEVIIRSPSESEIISRIIVFTVVLPLYVSVFLYAFKFRNEIEP